MPQKFRGLTRMYRNSRFWPEKCPKTWSVEITITPQPYQGLTSFKLCFLSFYKSFNLRQFSKLSEVFQFLCMQPYSIGEKAMLEKGHWKVVRAHSAIFINCCLAWRSEVFFKEFVPTCKIIVFGVGNEHDIKDRINSCRLWMVAPGQLKNFVSDDSQSSYSNLVSESPKM